MVQIPTDVTVAGDPAAEFDASISAGVTLYYRSTNNVFYQSSGIVHGWGDPFTPVHSGDGDVFTGNGAVVGNGDFEGRHMLVAKKSNNEIWWNACTRGVY